MFNITMYTLSTGFDKTIQKIILDHKSSEPDLRYCFVKSSLFDHSTNHEIYRVIEEYVILSIFIKTLIQ